MSFRTILTFALSMIASFSTLAGGTPQGSVFTYQGVLREGGAPANGAHHLRFQLWDALSGGSQVGANVDHPALSVVDGLFTADLDFGLLAFDGSARWLQVQVITDGGTTITPLSPRQALSPAPYALFALAADGANIPNLNASNITSGVLPNAQLTGIYDQPLALTHPSNTIDGTFTGNGAGLQFLDASAINSGVMASLFLPNTGAWSLRGTLNIDSNTLVVDPVNNRVGIGTNAPLTPLHVVGDAAALRLQDDDDPNSFGLLEDWQPGILRLMKFNGLSGSTLIDFDPMPSDPTGGGIIRVFRATNTTGLKAMQFYRGNGANEAHAAIAVDGANSYFQLGGGNVGIGTASPVGALHVRKTGPFMVLQDNASNANQAGYLGFWNSSGTETGWMGYGTPGSQHMSIFNGRSGGHIFLLPAATGSVGIGTTAPAAKLDVRGDIKLGSSGQYFANSVEENLRTLRGPFNGSASPLAGAGWTVTRPATGTYVISFSTPFAATPTVVASTGGTARSAVVLAPTITTVQVNVYSSAGALTNDNVQFIAIGPR